MKKRKSSTHAMKHPYLREELWADGTLVFWDTPFHRKESYQEFFNAKLAEAQKANRI